MVSELHNDNAPAAASSMLAQLQPPKAMRGCVFLISQNNICWDQWDQCQQAACVGGVLCRLRVSATFRGNFHYIQRRQLEVPNLCWKHLVAFGIFFFGSSNMVSPPDIGLCGSTWWHFHQGERVFFSSIVFRKISLTSFLSRQYRWGLCKIWVGLRREISRGLGLFLFVIFTSQH